MVDTKSKTVVVIASLAESLIRFRGALLKEMIRRGHTIYAIAPAGDASTIQSLSQLGVIFMQLPLARAGLNPLADLQYCFSLIKLLAGLKVDIVLSYTIKPVIYGSIAARLCRVSKITSMITGLGYAFTEGAGILRKLTSLIARALYRIALRQNNLVFFQNPDDRAVFEELKLITAYTEVELVNGSGVDLVEFAWSPPGNKPIFLLIARLVRDKGVIEFMDAARKVKEKYPHARFQIAGWIDSNPSSISKELLNTWVASGVVEYLGKLEDVRPTLRDCTVYVLPSYREGTPRSVLEAMAIGRPIITTDAPGCRETVISGYNGYLVRVKSSDELAQRMEAFLIDPELVLSMGLRSRHRAEEKYDVNAVNNQMLSAMGL
jgi:glycosyltransferase involved in cell wall biosynthesis